jgi:hypothetical protein
MRLNDCNFKNYFSAKTLITFFEAVLIERFDMTFYVLSFANITGLEYVRSVISISMNPTITS